MAKAKAKKETVAPVEAQEASVVTIANLQEEFGVEAKVIRAKVRSLGLKAPETKLTGFGPKAKYEWLEGSEELEMVRESLASLATK